MEYIIRHTASYQETIDLGHKVGRVLVEGDVVALVGELGSGKTCFAKGLALGIGVPPDIVINSPSFSLINEYEGMHTFFHIDTYRLTGLSDFLSVGLDEYFYKNGIVAMEWADRWPEILPAWSLKTRFFIEDESSRKIVLSGFHTRALKILKGIK